MLRYITILLLLSVPSAAGYSQVTAEVQRGATVHNSEYLLSTSQVVWLNKLERCESGGNHNAINPEDRDGTASLGGYQFKPQTLYSYATRYGILTDIEPYEIMNIVMDYWLQRETVIQMILHYDEIIWRIEFPDCVNLYVGMPPR